MTEGRWLDADERRQWLAFVFAKTLLDEQLERDLQRDSKIPFAYYQILVSLSESEGRSLRMSDLADMLLISRSRLSHSITKLESFGWVKRSPTPEDRRGAIACLTEKGLEVLRAAAPAHVESVRTHLFDQLTPEQMDQLRVICETLLDHLLPSLGWEPPGLLGCDDVVDPPRPRAKG